MVHVSFLSISTSVLYRPSPLPLFYPSAFLFLVFLVVSTGSDRNDIWRLRVLWTVELGGQIKMVGMMEYAAGGRVTNEESHVSVSARDPECCYWKRRAVL